MAKLIYTSKALDNLQRIKAYAAKRFGKGLCQGNYINR